MNIETWSHEPIQTWSSLHELTENKKDCHKVCMVTYQINDWIKAGVHLGEGTKRAGPLSLPMLLNVRSFGMQPCCNMEFLWLRSSFCQTRYQKWETCLSAMIPIRTNMIYSLYVFFIGISYLSTRLCGN